MERSTKINCPVCGAELDVEAVLGHRIEEHYKQEYNRRVADWETSAKKKESVLARKEIELKNQADALEIQIAEKTKVAIAQREKEIAQRTEAKVRSLYDVALQTEKERAADAERQLQEHKKTLIENERLKRQIESQKQDIELELEKKLAANDEQNRKMFDVKLKAERENIIKTETERNEERIAELQKQLSDARKSAEDAMRKAEQRSQQLQGEIQELAIEEFLRNTFPLDQVSEVKKGQYGADVVQVVRNTVGNISGTILYESKNTQNFGGDWIEKMKAEAAEAKADVLVLITKAMPKDKEHTELIEGVWVCPYKEFQGTARVLRESLLRVSDAYASQENKEGKAQLLYNYLTSPKFADQIHRVLTNFRDLRDGYEKEKTAMQKIWKKRDAQLDTVIKNLTGSFTPIQVIAGSDIPMLGAPETELLSIGEE